ncbi:MAG: hypothetical protein IJ009_06565 [Clostridia bacterium]|nr:hypothetical protein [Clostridia bacterium]
MAYTRPTVMSFSKEDVKKNILASATCQNAYCAKGDTFVCGKEVAYVSAAPDEII